MSIYAAEDHMGAAGRTHQPRPPKRGAAQGISSSKPIQSPSFQRILKIGRQEQVEWGR